MEWGGGGAAAGVPVKHERMHDSDSARLGGTMIVSALAPSSLQTCYTVLSAK